jgi:hypothetical protein
MPYTPFSSTTPTITQTRQQIVDSSRTNLLALRDAIMIGRVAGATLSTLGGTAEEPAQRIFASGTDRWRASYSYVGGFVSQVVWEYSSNSGGNYDVICTETSVIDIAGNTTSGTNQSLVSWLYEWMGKFKSLRTQFFAHVASVGTAVHGLGTMSTQNASAVAISGGTINGTPIGGSVRAIGNFLSAREQHVSVAFAAPTTIDWSLGGSFDFTASGSGAVTLAFANLPIATIATAITVDITNGGLRTWTYPAAVKWPGGIAPTLTASGRDVLQFYTRDGGTTIHGMLASKDSR